MTNKASRLKPLPQYSERSPTQKRILAVSMADRGVAGV